MAVRNFSRNPKDVKVKKGAAKSWFYEEGKGLEIIVEIEKTTPAGQSYKDYIHLFISWKTIITSLNRYLAK